MQDDRQGSIFILPYVDIQVSHHHLLKMPSFLQCMLLSSLSNIKWLSLLELLFGSCVLLHWSTCLFLCLYQIVLIIVGL